MLTSQVEEISNRTRVRHGSCKFRHLVCVNFSAGLAACDGQDSSTFVSSETHPQMLELAKVVSELKAVAKTAVRACCACFLLFNQVLLDLAYRLRYHCKATTLRCYWELQSANVTST